MSASDQDKPDRDTPEQGRPEQGRPERDRPEQDAPERAADSTPLRAQNRLLIAQAEALRAELDVCREEGRRLSALLIEARSDGRLARVSQILRQALSRLAARFRPGRDRDHR